MELEQPRQPPGEVRKRESRTRPDPGTELPEKIARKLADVRVSWDGSVFVDPLHGSERDAPEILDVCRGRSCSYCVTKVS